MNKKGKINDRERTFLLITIPVLVLFFCFNTLSADKMVLSIVLQTSKDMEPMILSDFETTKICLPTPAWEDLTCLLLNMQSFVRSL